MLLSFQTMNHTYILSKNKKKSIYNRLYTMYTLYIIQGVY